MTDLTGFKAFLDTQSKRGSRAFSPRTAFLCAMNDHLHADVYYGMTWLYAVHDVFPNSEQAEKRAFDFWQEWLFARGCRNAEQTAGVAA